MTPDQLHEAHRLRPFAPFEIRMADGRAYRVDHPELLATSPGGRTCAVVDEAGLIAVLDIRLITAIKSLGTGEDRSQHRRGA
jgi:hypothetical protein